MFDFVYAKKVISFLVNIVTISTIQNSGKMMKLRIAPNQAPLCTLVMIPKIRLVNGMIAKITQTNVGTVKSRISRARNKLQECLKPYLT